MQCDNIGNMPDPTAVIRHALWGLQQQQGSHVAVDCAKRYSLLTSEVYIDELWTIRQYSYARKL